MRRSLLLWVAVFCAGSAIGIHANTGQSAAETLGISADKPLLDPREAGTRYGQALGVSLVCYGMTTTLAVDRLASRYTAADKEAFQAVADKVLTSWREASTCKNAGGPNSCRLIHEWSCRDAMREIGPQGTKLPGLVMEKTSEQSNK